MYINRTENLPPRIQQTAKRNKAQSKDSFADALDSILIADAVEASFSRDNKKEERNKQEMNSQAEEASHESSEKAGNLNIEV